MEVSRLAKLGDILIGRKGHPEVEGTMGQYDPAAGIYLVEDLADVAALRVKDPSQLSYVTQTTLSVDDTQAIIAALMFVFLPWQRQRRRYLLCDSKSARRGKAVSA